MLYSNSLLNSVNAEKEHHLQTVTNLLEQSQVRMEIQLDERLEILDTFFEGLELEDEGQAQGTPKSWLQNSIIYCGCQSGLAIIKSEPWELNRMKLRDLIRDQINQLLLGLTIIRLVGAIERVLKEPLGFTSQDLQDKNWDDLSKQVIDGIEEIFTNRIDRFIGNGSPGQIASDLDTAIAKQDGDHIQRIDRI